MKTKVIFAIILSLPTWLMSCFNPNKVSSQSDTNPINTNMTLTSFYNLTATTLDGKTVSMSDYKGKKIIILNVASKCGYTPQYADWQKFYDAHKENTVVLGFPSNQFMSQEPGSASEIGAFCQKNYGVTFQMFDKVDVKGSNQNSIYKWLSDPAQNGWNSDVPSWNFCKYLIDENGKLTHFFASGIVPDSPEFIVAIK
ncbi:MAG: glutathione peroxidase [Saprospiraceae bacterium]|nr:glutathione peroxidase [Saprospiraceae bacterium]